VTKNKIKEHISALPWWILMVHAAIRSGLAFEN